jgi:hypothetical protein
MREIAYGDAMEAEQADFADFFRAEYETLLRAIYQISGSRDEAEELAQDTSSRPANAGNASGRWTIQPGISIGRR